MSSYELKTIPKKSWLSCIFLLIPIWAFAFEPTPSFEPTPLPETKALESAQVPSMVKINLQAPLSQPIVNANKIKEPIKSVADLTLNEAVLAFAEYTNNFSELILDLDEGYISLDPSLQTRDERVVIEVAFWYRYRF